MYIALFIAHARNGHISTSGLKSDVTIVFIDPDFLKDAKISAIRLHLRHRYGIFHSICMDFQDLLTLSVFGGSKMGKGVVIC